MRSWSRPAALAALAGVILVTSGCAPLAVGAAATAAGTAAAQEGGVQGAVTDAGIHAEINHLWFQHDVEMQRVLDMTVTNGRVLLTGRATTPEMRLDAVRLAWQARGVKEVINEVEVGDSGGLGATATDTWITTQLRSRLLFDRDIASRNYSIDTVGGVVYLMGAARDQTELDRVIGHARAVANVKRVVSYVRV
ncbi:BON domain-containing protein [Arenibaculum pallidiluteum]|uniref:BON domain-containing protein n=1 Tax=Arenibaculum pallidiluteum TaxID=2812559 RepID=UPI001A9784D2|nr:BON domain-containing protein [Arenibaculum pallidiluteum]